MRFVLLSLLLMSLIHQYNCLPRKPIPKKDSNVEINDEVNRLIDLLEKQTNTNKQVPTKQERTGSSQIPTIAKDRSTHVKQDGGGGTGACGGVPERLSASSGTIQSPGYDSSTYPNDATCQWIIEAPAGKVISVTVGEMSLEYQSDCGYDSLTLYDGSTGSSTVLKKLCGDVTASVTSSGSTVLVVFKSDYSVNAGRFSLSWTLAEEGGGTSACGGVPERLSASSGTIKSPGYDSSTYPNDATCQWIIEAPAGKVISVTVGEMSLEYQSSCGYDSLTLYDGSTDSSTVLKKLCGVVTASVTSSGSTVLVVFKSDYSVNSGRFSLTWTLTEQGPQCGSPAIEPDVTFSRIIGGREAKPNSWPWQCYLQAGGSYCGASVISNNYVLTAAHCVYKLGVGFKSDVKVICGVHDRSTMYNDPKAQHFTDVTVTIHEQYASANQYGYYGYYDIAVIRLNTPLTFNDYVQPACLPSAPIPDGTECVLTGFGKTETGYSNVLKQVVVPTINYDECKRIYEAAGKTLPHDVICLGVPAGGKSACFGDSGGPMVCKHDGKWWQYGVTDFVWSSTSCAGPNQPFGYADVVAYLPWIQQNSGVGPSARMGKNSMTKPASPINPVTKNARKYEVEKELLRLLRGKMSVAGQA